MIWLRVLVMFY